MGGGSGLFTNLKRSAKKIAKRVKGDNDKATDEKARAPLATDAPSATGEPTTSENQSALKNQHIVRVTNLNRLQSLMLTRWEAVRLLGPSDIGSPVSYIKEYGRRPQIGVGAEAPLEKQGGYHAQYQSLMLTRWEAVRLLGPSDIGSPVSYIKEYGRRPQIGVGAEAPLEKQGGYHAQYQSTANHGPQRAP